MKYIGTLFAFVFAVCTLNVMAQKSNNMEKIPTFNSCGESPSAPPRPDFMTDLYSISKSEIKNYAKQLQVKSKEFNYNYCIVVSSTVYNSDVQHVKKKVTTSDAEELAWQHARKRVYESYIDEFKAIITSGGSAMIDKASLENSMYQLITKEGKDGVSPLSPLKQVVAFDQCPDDNGYICYTLAYLRKDELDRRMKELKGFVEKAEPNENFEFLYNKWLKKTTK